MRHVCILSKVTHIMVFTNLPDQYAMRICKTGHVCALCHEQFDDIALKDGMYVSELADGHPCVITQYKTERDYLNLWTKFRNHQFPVKVCPICDTVTKSYKKEISLMRLENSTGFIMYDRNTKAYIKINDGKICTPSPGFRKCKCCPPETVSFPILECATCRIISKSIVLRTTTDSTILPVFYDNMAKNVCTKPGRPVWYKPSYDPAWQMGTKKYKGMMFFARVYMTSSTEYIILIGSDVLNCVGDSYNQFADAYRKGKYASQINHVVPEDATCIGLYAYVNSEIVSVDIRTPVAHCRHCAIAVPPKWKSVPRVYPKRNLALFFGREKMVCRLCMLPAKILYEVNNPISLFKAPIIRVCGLCSHQCGNCNVYFIGERCESCFSMSMYDRYLSNPYTNYV
jgi:hypothetical protein